MCRLTLASGTFETHKKPPAGKVPLKHEKGLYPTFPTVSA